MPFRPKFLSSKGKKFPVFSLLKTEIEVGGHCLLDRREVRDNWWI
jgi:hypothetical protein